MPTADCGADWEDGSVNISNSEFKDLAPGDRWPCGRGEAVDTRRAVMADQAGMAIAGKTMKECEA